ncbi:MAG: (E)-4-hydroxy-3-methylbut-2-enyl-diphosphate synthase [Prevotellaceae bacterium]|jgi:(E)-4-hydroxy-3-methylbut-2-enyl-diphosphate synthase|nr:(E)-4-hydroxy-3-methylbut-2-enyl-diphosphate synthase [Prevotellaceae bacterium]
MWNDNKLNISRRKSIPIKAGDITIGGNEPIVLQSMANTDTNNVEQSVAQCLRIVEAGGTMVRFTTQGAREAEHLRLIHQSLREKNCRTPLVADIHFNARIADLAAQTVEKVRINPGNYVASLKKKNDTSDYTDEEFTQELSDIKTRLALLLDICKANNTAIRIGVNHGSLSNRIMNRHGDTPQGMVESCLEFLRICREKNFDNIVLSLKTSNTVMMVHAVRLLAAEMEKERFHFPLHLGVTEAGDGEDGRIKSAVGIGTLLSEGIGDTIRVSLSEAPENEIPVARKIAEYATRPVHGKQETESAPNSFNPFSYKKQVSRSVKNIGGENAPVVIAQGAYQPDGKADYYLIGQRVISNDETAYPIFSIEDKAGIVDAEAEMVFVKINSQQLSDDFPAVLAVLAVLNEKQTIVLLLELLPEVSIVDVYTFFYALLSNNTPIPVVLYRQYSENDLEKLQISASIDFGRWFIDGLADGISIGNMGDIEAAAVSSVSFGILQATRVRISKTEFISCPGCGRTMFNLETVVARIKEKTSHLKGLKIGIMGCIVNGPGEMADADYGYVGAGKGTVSLYKKQICVESNIREDEAVNKLIELIKQNNDWVAP